MDWITSENATCAYRSVDAFVELAHHGYYSGAKRRSRDLSRWVCRSAGFGCFVGRFRSCVHMALLSARSTRTCVWWISDFPRDPTLAARYWACLCPPKGTSNERPWYPGRVHSASCFANRNRDCHISTRMVLPGFHDRIGSSLSSLCIYVWHVAICWSMHGSGCQRCCSRNALATIH